MTFTKITLITLILLLNCNISFAKNVNLDINYISQLVKDEKFNDAFSHINKIKSNKHLNKSIPKKIDFIFGYLNLKLRNYKEAIKAFKSINKKGDMKILFDYNQYYLSKAYYESKEYTFAKETLKQLEKDYKKGALTKSIKLLKIDNNIKLAKFTIAIKEMNDFIKKHKNYEELPMVIFKLGTVYEKLKKFKDAYKTYKKIHINFPLNKLNIKSKNRMNKIALTENVKKMKPNAQELLKRAEKLVSGGKFKDAIFDLKKIIKFSKNKNFKAKSNYLLGISYISIGNKKIGTNILKKLIRKNPKHKLVQKSLHKISRIYWNTGDPKNSIKVAKRLVKQFPNGDYTPKTLLLLGRINEDQNNKESSITFYKKLSKKYKKSRYAPEGSWRIGWVYYKDKAFKKAIKSFNNTINSFGSSYFADSAMYWKAKSLKKLKNVKKANKTFLKLAESFPYSYYGKLGKLEVSSIKKGDYSYNSNDYKDTITTNKSFKNLNKISKYLPNNKTIFELISIGLIKEAREELKELKKSSLYKNFDTLKVINSLYSEVLEFKKYFSNLNNYMDKVSRKNSINSLKKEFWKMYYPLGFWKEIKKYSKVNNLDPFLIAGLIRQESVYSPKALSRAGAKGLMQLMPITAEREIKKLKANITLKEDTLFDPDTNLKLGISHFSWLIKKLKGNVVLALIGYNAGYKKAVEWERRFKGLEDDLFIEHIPYPETRNYVKKILRNRNNYMFLYSAN